MASASLYVVFAQPNNFPGRQVPVKRRQLRAKRFPLPASASRSNVMRPSVDCHSVKHHLPYQWQWLSSYTEAGGSLHELVLSQGVCTDAAVELGQCCV